MGVSGDTDELINTAVEAAQRSGLVKTGDVVIISAGVPTGVSGTTNLKAHIVGNVLLRGEGVGSGCASGNVCTVNTLSDLESDFKDGNVIVTKNDHQRDAAPICAARAPSSWRAPTRSATRLWPARRWSIPLMMDRSYQAVHMLKSGMMITVDANEGFIYNGIKA